MNNAPVGYGASWQRAMYRGFPAAVPDIVKKYPRAPRSTVSPFSVTHVSLKGLGQSNTIGNDAVNIALSQIYDNQNPQIAMAYLNDPSITLTNEQRKALSDAIKYLAIIPESPDFSGVGFSGSAGGFPWMLLLIVPAVIFLWPKK